MPHGVAGCGLPEEIREEASFGLCAFNLLYSRVEKRPEQRLWQTGALSRSSDSALF